MSLSARQEFSLIADELIRRERSNRMNLYFPDEYTTDDFGVEFHPRSKYPKQIELFARGADVFARMFQAANGVGKTEAALYETIIHMRGWYPHWWVGRRFANPVDVWLCGETSETVKGIQQLKMLGHPYKEGTGMLPSNWLDHDSITRSGVPGAIDTFAVRHVSGGLSHGQFKSYKQGVTPFFGPEKHIIHLDELPPAAIYAECVARTRNRPGAYVMVTCSPKKGNTETVKLFSEREDPSRIVVTCGWADVPHLSEQWKENARKNTPAYLLPATEFGEVGRGAGAVYPILESDIVVDPFEIPAHWRYIWAMDGGFHNTAAVWGRYDKDNDTVYVVGDYKDGGAGTDLSVHAARFIERNKAFPTMPGVGDAAAINITDGKKVLDLYKAYGLNLRLANKSVEAGVSKVLSLMSSGKFKVFSTCAKFLAEFRSYSYEVDEDGSAGKIVKKDDHIMDATRYMTMDIELIADLPRKKTAAFNDHSVGY